MDQVWHRVVAAHEQYILARRKLLSGDAVGKLRAAIASRHGLYLVTDILRELAPNHPDIIEGLIPELFELALGPDELSIRAGDLLAVLELEILERDLEPLVVGVIEDFRLDSDQARGLVNLLQDFGWTDRLDQLARVLRKSDDEDLRDLAVDL